MSHVQSFPPIASEHARVLILGTMPGRVSLREQQYYAHPQNQFWRITGTILGFDPAAPYAERVTFMRAAGIAVWDVLKSCTRSGSLDSDIIPSSAVPNDLPVFLSRHPQIHHIRFNGAKAEALYARHVRPRLDDDRLDYLRLPSTSPAHASLSLATKLEAWRAGFL